MLSQYNPIRIEEILHAVPASAPFPTAADRTAWNEIRTAIGEQAAQIIRRAEQFAQTPIPDLPASLYLELRRTGQREGYQQPMGQRREMLATLALAECLENEGRFLDPILDVAWAICEESSWAYPAHQIDLADVTRPHIDLAVAMTALDLAELDHLLGPALDPALAKRIQDEVDRRCLTPYLSRHDHWWLFRSESREMNNWNAVCNAGVAGAAIYLEPDPARLAEILARTARSLDDYLATFDPDGGSSEGPGYWTYGFGHYVVLAHLVEQRTAGQMPFLGGEQIPQIARYPLRTVLSPGRPVNFSDCDRDVSFNPALLHFLSQRLDIPDLSLLAEQQTDGRRQQSLAWSLRDLAWPSERVGESESRSVGGRSTDIAPSDAPTFRPSDHDWFRGMAWMIARRDPGDPDGLVLAAKGGHNKEMHNQNDVGNFIVHYRGESLVADLGRGRYTRAYFGPQRYDHLVNSSLGHSVPVVNGLPQAFGREHAARVLDHHADATSDTLALDIKDAYPPEAKLESLERRITLLRDPAPGRVELTDTVQFACGPGNFESVLTTFARVTIGSETVNIQGDRGALQIRFDPAVVTPDLDEVPDVDFPDGPITVSRLRFTLAQPATTATIRLDLIPV